MKYSINSQNKVIYVQFSGPVSADKLIHHILTIRSDKFFQDGFNVLLDFRGAMVPKGYSELAEVAEFVKTTSVVRETFKMAILVNNEEQLRSANLYALLVRQNHVMIYEDYDQAMKWVARGMDLRKRTEEASEG